jgi:hypothetical protein
MDDDIFYEVHIPTETPELAGQVMRAAGEFGGFGARVYAIEDDRRRPVRFKELERMLLGATAYEPERPDESEPGAHCEIVDGIRSTLGAVKRTLLGQITL